ncbi:hypothetical protein [Paenibacillus dendritiformis]|nr:hypothetical protein [Paenibacillus dendritiformis]
MLYPAHRPARRQGVLLLLPAVMSVSPAMGKPLRIVREPRALNR